MDIAKGSNMSVTLVLKKMEMQERILKDVQEIVDRGQPNTICEVESVLELKGYYNLCPSALERDMFINAVITTMIKNHRLALQLKEQLKEQKCHQ